MRTLSLADFQAEGEAKGWRFQCPMCGNVASPADFKAAGADPQRAAQECIGRLMRPMPIPGLGKKPCDWSAFGLFKTAGRGVLVNMVDGSCIEAFDFDPREART